MIAPASLCFRIPMICSSLNLLFFTLSCSFRNFCCFGKPSLEWLSSVGQGHRPACDVPDRAARLRSANRRSAVDARTTRYEGYAISQRTRKRVEEVFGWMKTIALQRKTRFRGPDRTGWMFTLAAAAYNVVRMRNLQTA